MRQVSAAEACRITLLDGKERKFLLTNRGAKALRETFEVATIADLLNKPVLDLIGPMLIQSQFGDEKDLKDFSHEDFDELIPVNAEWCQRAVLSIVGVSLPDPNPPAPAEPASPETPQQ